MRDGTERLRRDEAKGRERIQAPKLNLTILARESIKAGKWLDPRRLRGKGIDKVQGKLHRDQVALQRKREIWEFSLSLLSLIRSLVKI